MARANSTLKNDRFSAGGLAAYSVMKSIEETLSNEGTGLTNEQYFANRDKVVRMALQAAETQENGFTAGFIAAFVEYSSMVISSQGEPNLQKWKPEASMTKTEKAGERERFARQVEEMANEVRPKSVALEKHKEDYYSSPEAFKEFALSWIDNSSSFQTMFSGEMERRNFGEVTVRFDEQSLRNIAEAHAALIRAVAAAKVCKVPRLHLVK